MDTVFPSLYAGEPQAFCRDPAQRALGRALISKPEILLLDEPLGALDAFTRMKMQREILDMWNITRQLVVMITHDVDEAVYMSTRVFVMEFGMQSDEYATEQMKSIVKDYIEVGLITATDDADAVIESLWHPLGSAE